MGYEDRDQGAVVTTTTVGDWWKSSSQGTTHVEASHCSSLDSHGGLIPVGGARAQCRFSGKTAKPLGPQQDWCPSENKSTQRGTRGKTCDGMGPPPDSGSRWAFNVDTWTWEPGVGSSAGDLERCKSLLPPPVNPNLFPVVEPRPVLSSVGGCYVVKQTLLREALFLLRHASLARRLGLNAGRGILLYGPSGCGKTFLAHALAGEAGVHFEMVNGAEATGNEVAEMRCRDAFRRARYNAPSILFLDDIDILAPVRNTSLNSSNDRRSTALLLSLLDELRSSGSNVVVIGATSLTSAVDPAVRRPGRLDKEVYLGAPSSVDDRRSILTCTTAGMPLARDVDVDNLALHLHGYLPADIAGIVQDAGLLCAFEHANEDHDIISSLNNIHNIKVAHRHFEAAIRGAGVPASLKSGLTVMRNLGLHEKAPDWEDLAGLEDVVAEVIDAIQWCTDPKRLHLASLMGLNEGLMSHQRGILLYGPPGCGKTLLARVIAAQSGMNFVSVRGPELLEKWLGESERAVRELFSSARTATPCIIFFDELDALAPARCATQGGMGGGPGTSAGGGADAANRVVNQLLCEMDGVENSSLFVLGATNRPETIDPALLRPGRFDRMIKVPLPSAKAKAAILRRSLRQCPLEPGLDLQRLAESEAMEGMSGADVAEVARRAGMQVIREYLKMEEERGDNTGTAEPQEGPCITSSYLELVIGEMRRSVRSQEAVRYEEFEADLADSIRYSEDVADHRSSPVDAEMIQALKNRVELLESLLQSAGLAVP